ncbi:hypothetical protein EXN66_Car001955 [Channa argus]|uniref:Uncharacterized protein n=1 Tax=Channa argus TaxID=215402 RepID=A0A6G1P7W8_CHAAH|nr:hypothetical protein EXN66_Car001955 [Channa argus]
MITGYFLIPLLRLFIRLFRINVNLSISAVVITQRQTLSEDGHQTTESLVNLKRRFTWRETQNMAPKLERFVSPGKGNGLRATAGIRRGELVLSAEPLACCVSNKVSRDVCHHCFTSWITAVQGRKLATAVMKVRDLRRLQIVSEGNVYTQQYESQREFAGKVGKEDIVP